MLYTVKYKLKGQWFFRTLKNVKGDGIVEHYNARYFILNDETRIEIPSNSYFVFSNKRFDLVKARAEAQIGQNIPVNKTN